ncbi:hypothetical protein FDO65_10835 [Nakamurella flava]|uniref:Uncharacterized protein n=1 Tax=Nakamurella flava TaxID=2576308 RepID=A0A4U6QNJ7_9ACTN|nr:hypothetical protein [Nakamurella flava]TKV61989.1 hypothetical protein FDO65_10835 [Nakamurella flava]
MTHDSTGFGLADGFALAGGNLAELWWRYVAVGGRADRNELHRRMHAEVTVDGREHNLIAQALNELFMDRQIPTFPVAYRAEAAPPRRTSRPSTSSTRARHWAGLARQRSAEANRRSVHLHLVAAQLMQTSGQLQFARAARHRADQALARSGPG